MLDIKCITPSCFQRPVKKISSRLLLYILMVSIGASLVTTVILLYFQYQADLEVLKRVQGEIVKSYLPILRENLWTVNKRETELVLKGISHLPNIQYVAIIGDKGEVKEYVGQLAEKNTIVLEHPISRLYKGEYLPLGVLKVVFTLEYINQRLITNASTIILSQWLMIFLISFLIITIFNTLVTRNLVTIASYFKTLDIENPLQPLVLRRSWQGKDELEEIVNSINKIRTKFINSKDEHLYLLDSLKKQREDLLAKNNELELIRQGLKNSEEIKSAILNGSIDGFMIVDQQGRIVEANESYCLLLGYSKEQMLLMRIDDIEGNEAPDDIAVHMQKVITEGHDRFETLHRHRNGHFIDIELSVNFDPSVGNVFFSFVRDISQRKRVEESLRASEERYRTMAETSADAICQLDITGKILFMNKAGGEIFGFPLEKLTKMNFLELITRKNLPQAQEYLSMACAGKKVQAELNVKKGQSGEIPISFSLSPLSKKGKVDGFTCISRDVTDKRKKEEESLRKSLEEKKCLLKEIHHRVKNNMQIISSLLSLQVEKVENQEVKALVNDSRHRVRTMSLIHEMLYQNENISMVDFEHYVNKLLRYLMDTFGTAGNTAFTVMARDVFLPIDIAIPCGLITTELVTNSLKYAFQDGRRGEISVRMIKEEGGNMTLTIRDNGVGLPDDFDINLSNTLGMSLVKTLARQLECTPELKNDNGLCFTLSCKGELV